ncbi:hypothetical protein CEXT_736421 [Caerostris extrusa]|uniref:Uncharacterized protein n=1 Tax=Caerostris extrusa TaxID=172846 RepID=A0AAV4RNE5_CAEEX|nr:hypothetical protein CEXT_736421 [Caerostris extrusa]
MFPSEMCILLILITADARLQVEPQSVSVEDSLVDPRKNGNPINRPCALKRIEDPRSPTEEISRTPIEVADKFPRDTNDVRYRLCFAENCISTFLNQCHTKLNKGVLLVGYLTGVKFKCEPDHNA